MGIRAQVGVASPDLSPLIPKIAYDDTLTTAHRSRLLGAIYDDPETSEADQDQISGYQEMLAMEARIGG